MSDLRRQIERRIALLEGRLDSGAGPLRDVYRRELAELRPLLKLDPEERGVTMNRWRMLDILRQCDLYVASFRAEAKRGGDGTLAAQGRRAVVIRGPPQPTLAFDSQAL
jgi:hypothetical protein